MFVLLCSFTKKKTGSVFTAFCHATFHHALITCCNVSRAGCFTYHDRDTFDFSQSHVTKNQPMAVEWNSRNITIYIVFSSCLRRVRSGLLCGHFLVCESVGASCSVVISKINMKSVLISSLLVFSQSFKQVSCNWSSSLNKNSVITVMSFVTF